MKTRVVSLLAVLTVFFLASCGYDDQPRWAKSFYSVFSQEREWSRLQDDIGRADHDYYFDTKLRNAGSKTNPHNGVDLMNDSRSVMIKQDSTGFVVVQLHKLAQIDSVQTKVDRINRFFFARGATRVLITGFRGSGTMVYSDKNSAEQGAASDR